MIQCYLFLISASALILWINWCKIKLVPEKTDLQMVSVTRKFGKIYPEHITMYRERVSIEEDVQM